MEPATWENCRADFAFDGALIDLLVPGTGLAEWETFLTALRSGPFELWADREGKPIPLPDTAAWIFTEREERAGVMVSVRSCAITANCHFFGGDLSLDIDPREVVDEQTFTSVLAVMRFLASALQLSVLAVAEGGTPQYAFIRVFPDGQAEFLRAGSVRHAEPSAAADPALKAGPGS